MAEFEIKSVVEDLHPLQIDVELIKNYLRIDFDDEDNDLMLDIMLKSAISFTQNYLKWSFSERTDIPGEVNIAILAITEHWYKNRGVMSEDATQKELPYVFSGILDMHRDYGIGFV